MKMYCSYVASIDVGKLYCMVCIININLLYEICYYIQINILIMVIEHEVAYI